MRCSARWRCRPGGRREPWDTARAIITSFNFGAHAFGVLADPGHQFTNCAFPGGTCAVQTIAHPNDYVLFTLSALAAPNLGLQFALAINPSPAKNLPFQFFGMDAAGRRSGPLLTKGP